MTLLPHDTTVPLDLFTGLLAVGARVRETHRPDFARGTVVETTAFASGVGADVTIEGATTLRVYRDDYGVTGLAGWSLDLEAPTSRFTLARVLSAGAVCPTCGGTGELVNPRRYHVCQEGYLHRPLFVWWALPQAENGRLPEELAHWSPRLLACAAYRHAAGLEPLLGVLDVPSEVTGHPPIVVGSPSISGAIVGPMGQRWIERGDARLFVDGRQRVTRERRYGDGGVFARLDGAGVLHLPYTPVVEG